jgi:hypothetical protein
MLELTKKILRNVSFDPKLFRKELLKSLNWIRDIDELKKFKDWCLNEFGSIYPIILQEVFIGLPKR